MMKMSTTDMNGYRLELTILQLDMHGFGFIFVLLPLGVLI